MVVVKRKDHTMDLSHLVPKSAVQIIHFYAEYIDTVPVVWEFFMVK